MASNRYLTPLSTFLVGDGNVALAGGYASGAITFPAAASITDGQTLTLSDGINPAVVFEFEKTGGVTAGRVAIDITSATTATQVGDAVVLAINGAANLNLASSNAAGVVTITNQVATADGNVSSWASNNTTINSAITQPTGGTTKIHSGTNSLNITNLQLAVLNGNDGETWVSPGATATTVDKIVLVQGTPNSSQINEANPFKIGDPPVVKGTVIDANTVKAVSTRRYQLPRFHVEHLRGFSNSLLNVSTADNIQRYKIVSTIEGVRTDITHGYNREVLSAVVDMPTTAPTDKIDFVLQNLALKMNRDYSKYVATPTFASGTLPFVVFGLKSSGGSGTTIGTLTAQSAAFNFAQYTVNGTTVQCTFKPTQTFINTLNTAIGNEAGLATATIENLGAVTPGSAATVDQLLVVTLHEGLLEVFDDVQSVVSRAVTQIGDAQVGNVNPTYTYEVVATGFNGSNTGRQVVLEYHRRARQRIFSLQNYVKNNEYPLLPKQYLDENQAGYTVTLIEHVKNNQPNLGLKSDSFTQEWICLPASVTNPTANANTGYTVATEDSDTVTALNNTLGVWLASNEGVEFKESATATTVFV